MDFLISGYSSCSKFQYSVSRCGPIFINLVWHLECTYVHFNLGNSQLSFSRYYFSLLAFWDFDFHALEPLITRVS